MASSRDFPHPLPHRADLHDSPAGSVLPAGEAILMARLESAEQTLRDVSYAFSHDLHRSMQNVASCAELLGDPSYVNQPRQVARLAQRLVRFSRHLQDLMDSVAALSRLQFGELQTTQVNAEEQVRLVVRELERDASGPRISWGVAQGLAPMHGDAALLLAVWRELLDNACRHAKAHPAPRIEVCCRAVPGGHAYSVSDNGQGFDPEHAAALFGLFRHRHGPPEAGLGVGLAMVRRIIECHGGTVWATSLPGQGARFSFSLPSPGPTV